MEDFLQDALGFCRWAIAKKIEDQQILITLIHDIGGLARHEECFSPRVSGYKANG